MVGGGFPLEMKHWGSDQRLLLQTALKKQQQDKKAPAEIEIVILINSLQLQDMFFN